MSRMLGRTLENSILSELLIHMSLYHRNPLIFLRSSGRGTRELRMELLSPQLLFFALYSTLISVPFRRRSFHLWLWDWRNSFGKWRSTEDTSSGCSPARSPSIRAWPGSVQPLPLIDAGLLSALAVAEVPTAPTLSPAFDWRRVILDSQWEV